MMLRIFFIACILQYAAVYGFMLQENATVDTKIDTLQLLLAEERQLRANLEANMGNVLDRINLMESRMSDCMCGVNSMERPAFMAGLHVDIDSCHKWETVVFKSVKINVGNGYNNIQGVFTAPVNGTYAFSATLGLEPNNEFHTALVKNSRDNEIAFLYADPSDIWLSRSTTVLTHLNTGDKVWMMCLDDSRIEGDHQHSWGGAGDFHSHMSAFLVSDE